MGLAPVPGSLDSLLQHILGLLDEQAVQIDCVFRYTAVRIVFAEDIVARLTVVLLHLRSMLLSLLRQFVSTRTITRLISLVGAIEAGTTLRCLLTSEVAETVVFSLGIVVGVVERLEESARTAEHNAIEWDRTARAH